MTTYDISPGSRRFGIACVLYTDDEEVCRFTDGYGDDTLTVTQQGCAMFAAWLQQWCITEYSGTFTEAWHWARETTEWAEKNAVDRDYMARIHATGHAVATAQAAALFGEGVRG